MVYSAPELLLVGEAENWVLGEFKPNPNLDILNEPAPEGEPEDSW